MSLKKFKNTILLLICALIWGTAFVAQKYGADLITPFMFNAIRSFMGGVFLIPVILILGDNAPRPVDGKKNTPLLLISGSLCGIVLFTASSFQQWGISSGTDAGKSGFITAMYIVLVPVFSIFLGNRATIRTWISVVIAVIGLYLICVKGDFTIELNDVSVICCAIVFAVHILVIDKYSSRVESVKMAMIQFFVCGVLSLLASFAIGESNTVENITSAYIPLLYTGILSSGIAFTLQIVAQRDIDPTIGSMVMSLESVFAVLGGLVFGEVLTIKEWIGCAVMFFAVILSQLPEKKIKIVYFGCDLFYNCFEYFVKNKKIEIVALHTFKAISPIDTSEKVIKLAKENNIPVYIGKPKSEDIEKYFENKVDFIFSAGFAHKIPTDVKNFRGVNLHPALLPVGRGPWPYPVTILKGLEISGVTLHKLEKEYDVGDILLQKSYPVSKDDTLDTLIEKSKQNALSLLPKLIKNFKKLWENAKPQGDGEFWDEPKDDARTIYGDMTVAEAEKIIRAFGGNVIFDGKEYFNNGEKTKISLLDGEITLF